MLAPYRVSAPPPPMPADTVIATSGVRIRTRLDDIILEALCLLLACLIIIVPALLIAWLAIATCGQCWK